MKKKYGFCGIMNDGMILYRMRYTNIEHGAKVFNYIKREGLHGRFYNYLSNNIPAIEIEVFTPAHYYIGVAKTFTIEANITKLKEKHQKIKQELF